MSHLRRLWERFANWLDRILVGPAPAPSEPPCLGCGPHNVQPPDHLTIEEV